MSCEFSTAKQVTSTNWSSQFRASGGHVAPPVSWTPLVGPMEPPLERSQVRSIGVHSILNSPPSRRASIIDPGIHHHHQQQQQQQQPSSRPLSRQSSSRSTPVSRPHSLSQQVASSPLNHSRRIITPISPSSRLPGVAPSSSRNPPYPSVHTFTSQSPSSLGSPAGPYNPPLASPLPLEPVLNQSVPSSSAPPPPSGRASIHYHQTPSFHSRQTSGIATNPNSQESSPSTPHSAVSPFGRLSPVVGGVSGPQPTPPFQEPLPFLAVDPPSSRFQPATTAAGGGGSTKPASDESSARRDSQQNPAIPGMIPCIVDLKSGSSNQAEKRKANSDASKRFRNRKKLEQQMEQRINAQQDEIRKQAEILRKQAEEIKTLAKERDFYRSERDFFRESGNGYSTGGSLPVRPPSPRSLRPPSLLETGDDSGSSGNNDSGNRSDTTRHGAGNLDTNSSLRPEIASATRVGLGPTSPGSQWSGASQATSSEPLTASLSSSASISHAEQHPDASFGSNSDQQVTPLNVPPYPRSWTTNRNE